MASRGAEVGQRYHGKQRTKDRGRACIAKRAVGDPVTKSGAESLGESDRLPVEEFGFGFMERMDLYASQRAVPY